MQPIILSIGSMLILLLITYFLPIGITLKGKLLIVLTSFVLSILGLSAMVTFSWEITALFLFVLILVITYIFVNKMSLSLFVEKITALKELDNIHEEFSTTETEEVEMKEIKNIKRDQERTLPLISEVGVMDVKDTSDQNEFTGANFEELDISHEWDIEPEENSLESKESLNNYLSEIESLLMIDEEDISPLGSEAQMVKKAENDKDSKIDDKFDLLFKTANEVARNQEEIKEIKLSLQK